MSWRPRRDEGLQPEPAVEVDSNLWNPHILSNEQQNLNHGMLPMRSAQWQMPALNSPVKLPIK
jgi:hypothetical protein